MQDDGLHLIETIAERLAIASWLDALMMGVFVVMIALAAFYGSKRLLLRFVPPESLSRHMLMRASKPARVAMPLVGLLLVWLASPDELRLIGLVRHATGLLLIASCTALVMRGLAGLADGIIARYPVDVVDNLQARRIHTQARVFSRLAQVVVFISGLAFMLMTFPGARQVGASLLASAGVLGIVVGFAARPLFSNLFAGLQIALAQPIRIDDVLIVQGEWGRVEEITSTYVVLKIWDERRMVIPLQWFIDNPFQNWTRTGAALIGSVFLWVDFKTPLAPLREELERVVRTCPEWDGRTVVLQVTDASDRAMQLRILATAPDAGKAFELRCKIREALIDFIQRQYPDCLPRLRVEERATPASVSAG